MGKTFPTMAELSARMQAEAAELPNQPVKLPDGWSFVPPFGTMGFAVLVRVIDGKNFRASADPRLWEKQILDFEFKDGAEWTDEQIAAMVSKPGAMRVRLPNNFTVSQATKDAFGEALSVPLDTLYGKSVPAADQPGYAGTDLARKTPWMALPATEIQVTDEMQKAAEEFMIRTGWCSLEEDVTAALYRAMRQLEPARDGDFQAMLKGYREQYALVATRDAEIALLRRALALKDARIAQLDTRLASTRVAFEDPDARLEPVSNPFREFGHDPRRMGPL